MLNEKFIMERMESNCQGVVLLPAISHLLSSGVLSFSLGSKH